MSEKNHNLYKKIITIFLFFYFLQFNFSQNSSDNFKTLNWLVGYWQKTDSITKNTSIENWRKESKTELVGIGCTLKGKDTVFIEKLKIISKNNKLYYVADVKENKKPTLFKFISITKDGFVCENKNHDFPKKIEYILNNKHLTVFISNSNKKIKFEFDKF